MIQTADRPAALADLNVLVHSCHSCPLGNTRTKAVPGEGNIDADIMLIGEAPGYYEDQQGRPFVGAAGQFLEQLLGSIGLKRHEVFIANVVKCRPPQNRDPLPEEIGACSDWLGQQLDIIRPKVVVTLGRYSLARFLPGQSIGRIHGQARKVAGQWVMPMYHPAAALHQGSLRKTIEDDFRKIPAILEVAMKEQQPVLVMQPTVPETPAVEQGKLF